MRVVIVGGGGIGQELAREILGRNRGDTVALVDLDGEVCERLARELDALVLSGDGTDPEVLRSARVAEADALVAATGSDAINTVVAMLGKRLGVPCIVARIEGVGLRPACHEIGVDAVVASKRAAATTILARLLHHRRLDFSIAAHGSMELVQFSAQTLAGRRLADLEVPDGALVVAVLRQPEETLLPRPSLELRERDDLLFLVEDERALKRVRRLLGLPEER